MVASAMTRRGALALLGALGLSLTLAAPDALAGSGLRFRAIVVNVAPLRALTGDPTAAWMEQALAQALPRALGPYLAPGVRNAPVLEVRIDWIYLAPSPGGPGPRGSAQDTIIGSFLVRGPQGGIELRFRCERSRPIIRAGWTRRSSSGPITGALQRSPRPSPAGRRGNSGSEGRELRAERTVSRGAFRSAASLVAPRYPGLGRSPLSPSPVFLALGLRRR